MEVIQAYDACSPCASIMMTLGIPELILFGILGALALISLFSKFNILSMMAKIGRIVDGSKRNGKPKKRKNKTSNIPGSPSPRQNL